jgi:hypothetical protein
MRAEVATLPGASVLDTLFEVCGDLRLKQIIARHNDPARKGRFRKTDAFLSATENTSGKASKVVPRLACRPLTLTHSQVSQTLRQT